MSLNSGAYDASLDAGRARHGLVALRFSPLALLAAQFCNRQTHPEGIRGDDNGRRAGYVVGVCADDDMLAADQLQRGLRGSSGPNLSSSQPCQHNSARESSLSREYLASFRLLRERSINAISCLPSSKHWISLPN